MIDYRARQTPVRNQGDRPTCVGFAVSAAHEWQADDQVFRSPEDAMWAGHKIGGPAHLEETSVNFALEGLTLHRHAEEEAWPYGVPRWPADRPAAARSAERQRTLPFWRLVPVTWGAVKGELAKAHPVILTLQLVVSAWVEGRPEVDASPATRPSTNHAVVAVGVVEASEGATESVIVKNSWGERWGVNGYGFVSRRYFEHFGVRAHVLDL